MGNPLGIVDWVEQNEVIDDLLIQGDTLTMHPMEHGFEAEVMKICSDKDSFVLKVWNKSSKPDVSFQYRLLNVLFERGMSVSKPVGWGINPNKDKVLLTTFEGTPILKMNEKNDRDCEHLINNTSN